MKKLTFIILCLMSVNLLHAQKKKGDQKIKGKKVEKVKAKKVEEAGKMIVGVHAGLSFVGLLYEARERDTVTIKYTTSVKPAFQATFDYFYSNRVTVGFFTSIQPFRVDISFWQFDTINHKSIEDVQAKMKRVYIGGRLLYHYKNTEKIDIYSGIRGGAFFWSNKLPSSDPNFVSSFEEEFPMLNRPSIGLIPIGFRIKFSPQFAANVELNASAPHILSFGACYTFK